MGAGYFVDMARHLTDEERADVKAIINKPFIDQEVVYEILSEGGASINEMFHWTTNKRLVCHKMKVDEPAFTKDELLAICNAEKEEDKRRMFSEIMTSKMECVLQNKAEIRGVGMKDVMTLQVPLTTEEIAVRAKELSETLEKKSDIESSMKFAATSFKKEIAGLDEKLKALCQMVSSGKEYRQVDVIDRPNYERGLMETFRLDTGEIVKYRELKESEKTKSLFPEPEQSEDETVIAFPAAITPEEASVQ